jgi:hypothetical protein
MRAYFSPVDRPSQTPVLFDPSQQGRFSLDTPPEPWVDLGWIQGLTRKPMSKTTPVLSGIPAATLEQVRETLQAEVSFRFLNWTKLTMALATGSQHMNLLSPVSGAPIAADGAQAATAVVIGNGSTSNFLVLSNSDVEKFSAGDLVAVDVDYTGQTGYVGTPVCGAYVRKVLADVDYIRRVTFNVGRISAVTSSGITLVSALPGGAPASGAKLQKLLGFTDREGGSFYQEWSALFVAEGSQGDRIIFYYPRLQTACGAEEAVESIDSKQKDGLSRVLLKAQFMAMPIGDALDGERIVCYRSYLPAENALI